MPDRSGGGVGSFVFHNPFAGFVELVVPLGLAVLCSARVPEGQLPARSLFTIGRIAALVLSTSRGGITRCLLEVAFLAFVLGAREDRGKRLLKAACLLSVTGVLLVWLGIGSTVQRFEELSGSSDPSVGRVSLSRESWQIFVHHPWTGTGMGAFKTAYPLSASFYDGLRVDHPHTHYFH